MLAYISRRAAGTASGERLSRFAVHDMGVSEKKWHTACLNLRVLYNKQEHYDLGFVLVSVLF